MELLTQDEKKYVDIGSYDIWKSVYSTVIILLEDSIEEISLAVNFLKTGECEGIYSLETARQINIIRDRLAQYKPEQAVYDYEHPNIKAPWEGQISPVITSCANLYTTADGKDLLYELVVILTYASIKRINITRI